MMHSNLSPWVSVAYWRNTPVGILRVGTIQVADFAIVEVRSSQGNIAARFELPQAEPALVVTLAAAEMAYALGHHDRRNRFRKTLGLDPIDVVLPCQREDFDV